MRARRHQLIDDGSPGEPTPARSGSTPPLSLAQRCWFIGATVLGAIFLFVLPPYQGDDEYKHWLRAWTVAEGRIRCGEIPQAAIEAREPFALGAFQDQLALATFDTAIQQVPSQGTTRVYTRRACVAPPFAYVVPAAVMSAVVGDGENGGIAKVDMLQALYGARALNWACLLLAVLCFLRFLPAYRNVTLFFYSIPEVFDQTSAIGIDLTLCILMLVMLGALVRAPGIWRIAVIGVVAVLMAMINPVFCLVGLLALPALLELHATRGGRTWGYVGVALLLLLMPLLLWKAWEVFANVPPRYNEGVDPWRQMAFLNDQPLRVFVLSWNQLGDTFGHDLMRGSWTSILGSFGPGRVELPMEACWLLLLALGLAVFGDLASAGPAQPITPLTGKSPLGRASWVVAAGSVAAIIPGTVLVSYFIRTPVGADSVYGVQGRYYLVPFFMLLVLGMRRVPWRWPRLPKRWVRLATWIAAIACVCAGLVAILAVVDSYWHSG